MLREHLRLISIHTRLLEIIGTGDSAPITELLLYQRYYLLSRTEMRSQSVRDDQLSQLWMHCSPTEATPARPSMAWQSIGFQSSNPESDFRGVGQLGVCALLHLVSASSDFWQSVLSKNAFPPVQTASNIVEMLSGIFEIDDPPNLLNPLLFSSPDPFFDLFTVAYRLFDNMWSDSKATVMDFSRVLNDVKRQLEQELQVQTSVTGLERVFARTAKVQTPQRIRRLEQEVGPLVRILVLEQKSRVMHNGSIVQDKPSGEYKFLKLSKDNSEILFGPASVTADGQPTKPAILSNVAKLKNFVRLQRGAECAFMQQYKKKTQQGLLDRAFSLTFDTTLDVITATAEECRVWCDGISLLTSPEPKLSFESEEEIRQLVEMEVKVRLRHLADEPLDQVPPSIPAPVDAP
jgi:hypothetical protein